MKFQEGDSVEVLKKEHEPCGSWFPGNIIAVSGDYYIIRYDSFADCEGEPVMEKVLKEDVRPRPTHKRGKRWMVGDVAEVFDIRSWRVGKIVKVLKNKLFVIRLFGSIQLKEFHESNLRIRQAWQKNCWSVIGKVDKESTKNFAQNKSKFSGTLVCSFPLEVIGKDSCLRKRNGHNNVKKCLPARMVNSSNTNCLEKSSKYLLSCVGGCHRPLIPFFRRTDDISAREELADDKFDEGYREIYADIDRQTTGQLYNSCRPLSTEESDQCSVASCSSNDFALSRSLNRNNRTLENISDNSDAESSVPSSSVNIHLTPYFEQKLEADIHELEFHAYRSTVRALYASGPLSWEQESLLTNLRLSLHISDEEHLLQLRHLLSAQVV